MSFCRTPVDVYLNGTLVKLPALIARIAFYVCSISDSTEWVETSFDTKLFMGHSWLIGYFPPRQEMGGLYQDQRPSCRV